jgi:hypothetical protein
MPELDLSRVHARFLSFAWANLWPRERAKVLAGCPKTVWLFGAGASHHYDLNPWGVPVPLANDFIRAMHNLPTSQGFHSHIGPLVNFLENYRGLDPRKVPQWSENIESFMTSIEDGINELRQKKTKRSLTADEMSSGFSLSTAFNNMSFICANVINESQNGPVDPVYRSLLDFCGPEDVFVTFNWDTLLDRALVATGGWSPNGGYGLSFAASLDGEWRKRVAGAVGHKTYWKLLKLHGSVNWLVPHTGVKLDTLEYTSIGPSSKKVFLYWQTTLPYQTHRGRWRGGYAPTCYGYYPPNLPVQYFRPQHIAVPKGHVLLSVTPISVYAALKEPNDPGVPSSPLLITPVRQKAYASYGRTIGSLWSQAEAAIKNAARLVIAGYSFPETDTRAVGLLRKAIESGAMASVEVVAPDADEIVARLKENIGESDKLHARPMTLADYVFGVLGGTAPIRMIEAAETSPEVKAWLQRVLLLYAAGLRRQKSPRKKT